jgi:hypothetical protein
MMAGGAAVWFAGMAWVEGPFRVPVIACGFLVFIVGFMQWRQGGQG